MAYKLNQAIVEILRKFEHQTDQLAKQFCHQKVIFLHIPKCGGTSISSAIADSINANTSGLIDPINTRETAEEILKEPSQRLLFMLQLRQAILLEKYLKNEPYIFGHFPIVRKVFKEPKEYLLVTVLREPVERFISQFKYYLATRRISQLEYTQVLNLEEIECLWKNYLNSNLAVFHANTLTSYLNDDTSLGIGTETSSDRAIDNLKYFHIIGFLDQLEIFAEQLTQRIGSEVTIASKNQTHDKMSTNQSEIFREFFNEEKLSIIDEMCFYDKKIYQYARGLKTY